MVETEESISVTETPDERNNAPLQQQAAATDGGLDSNNNNDEEEQEIQEWNLRFLFGEYKFLGPVWQGLQDAGWTYVAARNIYRSPHGTEFVGGKEIAEYLDLFCIPPILNTLQLPPEPLNMSAEEVKQGQELRECVVRHVYKRMMESTNGDHDNKDESDEEPEKPAPKRARVTRRQSAKGGTAASKTSATTFEKGADTFLRRSRGGGTNKTVSSQDFVFLKFPNVLQCVEQFRDKASTESVQQIEQEYKEDFDDWKFLLTTQNSLLIYGFGSKKCLLEAFIKDKLEKEGDVLSIDGFDREVRIESILDLLVDQFLDGSEPLEEDIHDTIVDNSSRVGVTAPSMIATLEIVKRATRIARSLAVKQKEQGRPLFLVVHNIDGPCLCNRDIQQALAALVAHSTIESGVNAVRLVASIDHVNASALLWDNGTAANFSFVWKEVHTYRPYVEELAVGTVQNNNKKHRSKKRQVDDMEDATLWNVLASLAPRHAEVVKILATLQSEDLKPVDHTALLRNCKHKMTVTNDSTLRAYLLELKDHGIVETGKDPSTGREWLRIPHSREKLFAIRDFEME